VPVLRVEEPEERVAVLEPAERVVLALVERVAVALVERVAVALVERVAVALVERVAVARLEFTSVARPLVAALERVLPCARVAVPAERVLVLLARLTAVERLAAVFVLPKVRLLFIFLALVASLRVAPRAIPAPSLARTVDVLRISLAFTRPALRRSKERSG